MTKHVSLTITGTVHNVGFRYFTQQTARANHITGFARNNNDGTVSVEGCGSIDALGTLLSACSTGPTHAKVRNVEHIWSAHDNTCTYHEFTTY